MFEFINAHELPPEFKVAMPWSDEVKEATLKRAAANTSTAQKANLSKKTPMKRDVDRDDLMNV